MMFPFSYAIFFFSLLLGSIITISSTSWFTAWVGLELNMMSFIPLIAIKMNSYSSEAALKYFLIQALGSSLLIMSSFLSISFLTISFILILLTLLLKLAGAPFHFWFPQVMEGLTWPQAFLLSTIQKLGPMILVSYLLIETILLKMVIFSSILSALIGALGGLNQMLLRKMIAFSSINHMSWMLIAISTGDAFWLLYFFIYSMILLSIMSIFHEMQVFSLSNLAQSDHSSSLRSLLISFNFLSLSGLPPFTGFIPKWIIIQIMINSSLFIPLFFFIISALITLYFYLRLIINFLLFTNPTMNFNMKYNSLPSNYSSIFLKSSFNFIGLFMPFYFLLL
uniref:NADH dehydrogenase subunit 2 n=1 Tax=Plagusia squamosa TaxID=157785 RepID=UPI0020284531|nr:NADH dehydrogenase subunit 2 [Plagusia squamosa]UPL65012.1 NADH dehydrogenase subunit 2 [Plagusia squamosa]